MTGMKEGAGEDPFAEEEDANSSDAERAGEDTHSGEATDSQRADDSEREPQIRIPYKFRRDGVQDGRDRVPLFLQADTKSAEREAVRTLEERFGDDVALTDLREAVVKAGLDNLNEVESHLEEWGYGMTFEE
jgi:hypothetical protein